MWSFCKTNSPPKFNRLLFDFPPFLRSGVLLWTKSMSGRWIIKADFMQAASKNLKHFIFTQLFGIYLVLLMF